MNESKYFNSKNDCLWRHHDKAGEWEKQGRYWLEACRGVFSRLWFKEKIVSGNGLQGNQYLVE